MIYSPEARFTPTCVGTTPGLIKLLRGLQRFTPTCVGTTAPSVRSSVRASVHPHVRGDDVWMLYGKRAGGRFTPTCVGTTYYG